MATALQSFLLTVYLAWRQCAKLLKMGRLPGKTVPGLSSAAPKGSKMLVSAYIPSISIAKRFVLNCCSLANIQITSSSMAFVQIIPKPPAPSSIAGDKFRDVRRREMARFFRLLTGLVADYELMITGVR